MSGQARTRAMLGGLAVSPMILRNFCQFNAANLRRSLEQHREMTLAITSQNSAWAGSVMRAHVQADQAIFLAAARNGEDGRPAA